mmetsp:Transcript_25585/g.51354  ORF Transcript_25585/g.51354 Transcript_25585/m.51354 type:complete len:223 (+) Transcript_25585:69-737(+)
MPNRDVAKVKPMLYILLYRRQVSGGKNSASSTEHFTIHHAEVRFLNEITFEYEFFRSSREKTPCGKTPFVEEEEAVKFWVDRSTGTKVRSPEEKLEEDLKFKCLSYRLSGGTVYLLMWLLSFGGIISSLIASGWVIGRTAARFQTKHEYFTGIFANSSSIGLWVFLMFWALATALHMLTRYWKHCNCAKRGSYNPGEEALGTSVYARVMKKAPLPRSSMEDL